MVLSVAAGRRCIADSLRLAIQKAGGKTDCDCEDEVPILPFHPFCDAAIAFSTDCSH